MFKLESNRLKREFKIVNQKFFASQILNKYSEMSFVPDGNGNEFEIHFVDGTEYTSKFLSVKESKQEDDKLIFVFDEYMGVTITLKYWVHKDNNTLCKQLVIDQKDSRIIDHVVLENIGIVNSKSHFSVDIMPKGEVPEFEASLGQPFYIDSLFFGCEFPATENRIMNGAGKIKYYLGKNVGKNFECPVTVIGAAKDNSIIAVKKAFFEYIDSISAGTTLRFQFNSWYDYMRNINEGNILQSFSEVRDKLKAYDAPALDSYVMDDGWVNLKSSFWSFNSKFPNGLEKISAWCQANGSNVGIWLSPRGGYFDQYKFAKRMERAKMAYANKQERAICIASTRYTDNLSKFLVEQTKLNNINYWKLDAFNQHACTDPRHDHIVGGYNNMYHYTEMWHKWIKVFNNMRSANPNMWINMTCYINLSPWWLQWVNSLWVQNSRDIGFANNYQEQPQVESEITYRDSIYYDCICTRAHQIQLKALYNHEPIYGNEAHVCYTDAEFEKYIFWCTVRGNALNELHLSCNMMSEGKWKALSNAMNFQKDNYHILQNATFIGGKPDENNIYGYISWTDDGEGIIALRNPTKEKTDLTLNLNKLMGVPEDLNGVRMQKIYCHSSIQEKVSYSYKDSIDLTLSPFEAVILKFTK